MCLAKTWRVVIVGRLLKKTWVGEWTILEIFKDNRSQILHMTLTCAAFNSPLQSHCLPHSSIYPHSWHARVPKLVFPYQSKHISKFQPQLHYLLISQFFGNHFDVIEQPYAAISPLSKQFSVNYFQKRSAFTRTDLNSHSFSNLIDIRYYAKISANYRIFSYQSLRFASKSPKAPNTENILGDFSMDASCRPNECKKKPLKMAANYYNCRYP